VADASVVYANAACGVLIERDASSLVGRSLGDALSDPETLAAIEGVCAAARSGTFAPLSFALRRSDGGELRAEVAVAATPDRVEDVGFVVILRDATDRHVAERAMLAMHAALAEHETVKRSEERLRALFARTPAITYTIDREMTITSSLGGGLRAIGLEPDQAVGWPLSAIFSDETSSRPLALHKRALRGESVNYERFHNGRKLSVFLEPIWTRERSVEGVSGIVFDLTESAATEYLLEQTEALTARAERAARTGSWKHDIVRDRIVYSEQSLRIFGVTDRASARESFYACVVPEDRERVRAQRAQAYKSTVETTFEYQIAVGGTIKFIHESVEVMRDGNGVAQRADGIVVDITDRRHAELESFRRTETDAVTGLPNRVALVALVRRRLAAGKRYGAVLAVNIDRFRSTNDGFGRDFGDRVLIAVAERLVDVLPPTTYVARFENATFAVLFEDADPKDAVGGVDPKDAVGGVDPKDAVGGVDPKDVAARLHDAFRVPFELEGHRLAPTISIGIAAVAGDEAAESMTRKADVALQAAKRAGGDRTVTFDDDLARMSSRRVALELDLRSAIERKELSLEYQPIVDEREEIVAVEALLRWHHPAFGRVPPDEFIPIAEANGTIVPIGRWVVRTACADLAEIRTACGRAIRVAVNVSAKQFSDAHLQTVIGDALATAGLEPAALEIEITESTLANNPAQASRILAQLRTAGTTVSIDDFGTGYSSLSSLRRLPIDSVKIDRSFVATTPGDAEACAIVEAILGLAKQLSLGVVAEGVETAEQSRYLHDLGTHRLQGYFFSRPAPATTIIELVCEAAREKTLRPERSTSRARRAETA
jgi:PAS domain S-box-containing protein